MDSSANATIVSENREGQSREQKKERKKIFARARSTGYATAKSFKVVMTHMGTPTDAEATLTKCFPSVKTPTKLQHTSSDSDDFPRLNLDLNSLHARSAKFSLPRYSAKQAREVYRTKLFRDLKDKNSKPVEP